MPTQTELLAHKIHHEAQRYGPVSKRAAERTAEWLTTMRDLNLEQWLQDPPSISGSPESEVVLEWWANGIKITQTLMQIWGPNIESEMTEYDPTDIALATAAWKWLRKEGDAAPE